MELKCRKTSKSNILLIIAIILYTVSISMYALLNSNYSAFNIYNVSTPAEVKSVVECEFKDVVTDSMIDDIINNIANQIYKAVSKSKIISILSSADILVSIYFQTILFVIVMIFCSNLFIFLPDDWTLLNQKVRLND